MHESARKGILRAPERVVHRTASQISARRRALRRFDGTTPVLRAYNNGFARGVDSNHRITSNLESIAQVVARGWINEGVVMCAPPSTREVEADIVRLLEQGTLGPTEALVQEVKGKGIGPWIDEQLGLNVTRFTQLPFYNLPAGENCMDDRTPPVSPEKFCSTYNQSPDTIALEFYRQARTAPDQLRMRMAHVWHRILVLNNSAVVQAYGIADFQQRLRDRALGTFEELLLSYALSPATAAREANFIGSCPNS